MPLAVVRRSSDEGDPFRAQLFKQRQTLGASLPLEALEQALGVEVDALGAHLQGSVRQAGVRRQAQNHSA